MYRKSIFLLIVGHIRVTTSNPAYKCRGILVYRVIGIVYARNMRAQQQDFAVHRIESHNVQTVPICSVLLWQPEAEREYSPLVILDSEWPRMIFLDRRNRFWRKA